MNVNQILPVSATGVNQTATQGTGQRQLDQGAFLKLLVAQLKNQDPETPQDPSAFTAQLAQFSQLDQLIGIRQSLAELAAKLK